MKLASIETIEEVNPHPNADRLEICKVLGYNVIARKDEHVPGDKVIFIKPDTVLPDDDWAKEYKKYSPKRVKAVKLRGEWSEGIIIDPYEVGWDIPSVWDVGKDVSDKLGIVKYEPPEPQELNAKGLMPYDIPKTDEERWENWEDKIPWGEICDVTQKIDGQSWSAYYNVEDNIFGILGRKLEYKLDCSNNYTRHLKIYGFKERFIDYCKSVNKSLCIRGESYGSNIQKSKANPHSSLPLSLAIFSVWLIDERRYARKGDEFYFENVCDKIRMPRVPILEHDVVLTKELVEKYSVGIEKLPSGSMFEGVVINTPTMTFKVINKYYDSKK